MAGVAGVAFAAAGFMQAKADRKHLAVPSGERALPLPNPASCGESAAATTLRAPVGRLPEHVRGRDDLVAGLCSLVQAPDMRVHVLTGPGGTGKSTVALGVAEEATRLGRPAWWVTAADPGMVTAKLLGLARDLGAPDGEVSEVLSGRRDPADLLWRFLEARQGWLLIFDNVDDPEVLAVGGNEAGGGAGWIRPSASGLIIVTSREGDRRAWGQHAEVHAVSWLDADTGAQVLTDLAPDAGRYEDAVVLSERLGGLPLALHHAGSQLRSDFAAEKTFRDYALALDERFARLMGRGAADEREIVASTWELSLDTLAARGLPQARQLLRVLACLAPSVPVPPPVINLEILGRVCDGTADGAAEGLAALESVGLIAAIPGPAQGEASIIIHPLIAETSRLHLDAEGPRQAGSVAVALLIAASAALRSDHPSDWHEWSQLMPHLESAYGYLAGKLADDDLTAFAEVIDSAAAATMSAGSYPAGRDLAESALRQAARLGPSHPVVLSLCFRIAVAHYLRGEHAAAEQRYRSVLGSMVQVFGPDDHRTLKTRQELGRALTVQGRYREAEQDFRDVVAARQRIQGPGHPDILDTQHNLAWVLARQGHYQEAEQNLREVLTARLRVQGPDHPSTLEARHEITRLLADQGHYEQAERELRALSAAAQRIQGADHPDTLSIRYEFGWILAIRGHYKRAEHEIRGVLALERRVLGPDHPRTRIAQDSLTALLEGRPGDIRGRRREQLPRPDQHP